MDCFFASVQARDIYEEAIQTVVTVRDFSQVFDTYSQFEERIVKAKMETTAELGPTEEGDKYVHDIVEIVWKFQFLSLMMMVMMGFVHPSLYISTLILVRDRKY